MRKPDALVLPRCADDASFCRWSEVTRRLELWIQILEINESGDFVPVEVVPARDERTGGIFQLRQVRAEPQRNPQSTSSQQLEPANVRWKASC